MKTLKLKPAYRVKDWGVKIEEGYGIEVIENSWSTRTKKILFLNKKEEVSLLYDSEVTFSRDIAGTRLLEEKRRYKEYLEREIKENQEKLKTL